MSDRIRSHFWLTVALLAFHPHAIGAESVAPERAEFVIGNAYYVLLHEFAHVIMHDFDIPILGNEEDAADTLAATTLIRLDKQMTTNDFRHTKMLLMAADANRILWQRGVELENLEAAYWANHPLSAQRAARILCLVYGSDVEVFAPLPEMIDMPLFRSDWCEEEYELADAGREWVRRTYGTEEVRRPLEVAVTYQKAKHPDHQIIERFLKRENILEKTADYVRSHFALPAELTLSARACGVPDAYWDEDAREVVLCYELMEAFYKLSVEQKVQVLEQGLREIH
jgi:hypothetical protein